jgi:hypothetical protein
VINPGVGVWVGTLEGRLQAVRAKTRATRNKLRDFITLLLLVSTLSYTKMERKAIALRISLINPHCGHSGDFDNIEVLHFGLFYDRIR